MYRHNCDPIFLTPNIGWDASAYFVDRLNFPGVPSYTRLDSGLSWRAGERWSLSVVGQNLLKDTHLEFASGDSWFPRSSSAGPM